MRVNTGAKLLSVVIPVYNREGLVRRAVRSVLTQELPRQWELELIVVDDGSTDGTVQAVHALQPPAPPETPETGGSRSLQVVTRPHEGTPGAVRNQGVLRARGELLAFLDSDDQWLPGKVSQQIPLHVDRRQEFSHTRERWIRDGREVSQAGRRFSRYRRAGDLLEDSLIKCIIGPSTVMMTRKLWEETGGFREDLEIAEDYEYWLRVAAVTEVAYLDTPFTVKYAGHGDQLSEKYGRIEQFRIAGLRDLVESRWFARARGEAAQECARRELLRKADIYARGAQKRGRIEEAQQYEALRERNSRCERRNEFHN